MARIARVVVPRHPHPVTQRSNRRQPADGETGRKLPHHERAGRPLGDENFLTNPDGLLNRVLKPRKPGPKPEKQEKVVWCPAIM